MEIVGNKNIFIVWFFWHFFEMPKFLVSAWQNYIKYGLNSFSVPLLLKTLISPWRRYNWVYPKIFDLKEYANTFVSNIFSRLIGAMCRIVLIIIGLIFQIFILLAGVAVLLFWLALPLLVLALFGLAFLL